MKITVSHERPVEEVKQAIDRSFDDVFKAAVNMPIELLQEQRSWQGNTLAFSLVAKMGFMSSPIKGTIAVTAQDLTIDVDLGMLEHLLPTEKVRDAVSNKVKGLLK